MGYSKEQSFIIAQRLKELREGLHKRERFLKYTQGKIVSHLKLSKILSEKYDISISKDTLMNYEAEKYHTKEYKNLGMNIEYLYCLADFYGVSTDYILGKTDDPRTQATAVDELGLPPGVIDWLQSLSESSRANKILTNPNFQRLVYDLCDMIDAVEAEKIYYKESGNQTGLPESKIQQIAESGEYDSDVINYLRAQNHVAGIDAPDTITDVFPFGFNISDIVAHRIEQQFHKLIEDIRGKKNKRKVRRK